MAELGVSSRVYYTAGDKDEELLAITDSKIVRLLGQQRRLSSGRRTIPASSGRLVPDSWPNRPQ
jgi:hypothetical protein